MRVSVPERPRLAPGVRLAGQMEESAFEEAPWLLERVGSGYVQVTELLYRIAEQCDGRRTLAEIAERVSKQNGRSVSADNVKQLVGTQLLLKGLVATADGKVVGGARPGRSPLALNAKLRVVRPEVVEPLARALSPLFWPPLVILATVDIILAQGWLYMVHGVPGGIHDALYQPSLLLLALGAAVLSAALHELGHAAALRYGGGEAKGMGVGLYLVYPAFYTDVSDNYRLPRWARVRTDLGGFYFNLLFSLAVMGVYALTGQEFLLVIVTLVNLEIVRQLLPLVRLDGYWVLADLTGIPDFFSQMGAFARSVLPIGGTEGRRLPELKWWGKAVFAAYILITVPLLLFMMFLMIRGTPRILATAWDSFQRQGGQLAQAQSAGDGLAMAASGAQILVLALPTVGLVYSLYRLARRGLGAIWSWSKPTPARRAIGALGTLGVVGLVAYLWAPQLPWGRPGPLYVPTQSQFVPLQREERGTLYDAIPLAAPSPKPSDEADPAPVPAASPEAIGSPPPAPGATVQPSGGATSAPANAPRATPTSSPNAAPTPAPATGTPALAPAAPLVPSKLTSPPGPTPAPAPALTP